MFILQWVPVPMCIDHQHRYRLNRLCVCVFVFVAVENCYPKQSMSMGLLNSVTFGAFLWQM